MARVKMSQLYFSPAKALSDSATLLIELEELKEPPWKVTFQQ